ncbi:hypothetical protein HHK36_018499 [Tetracentron sinense]|uniref:Uncharacterized protein n=1 Tax=Tetracentron sinense TaxID=13715 RepID=A0A834YW37_TETSI|nr:hypothetical protein HHK36_018499 [Tetracentron sinense]
MTEITVGDGVSGAGAGVGVGVSAGDSSRVGSQSKDRVKGPWSPEEDAILSRLVSKFGARNWSLMARGISGRVPSIDEALRAATSASVSGLFKFLRPGLCLQSTDIQDADMWSVAVSLQPPELFDLSSHLISRCKHSGSDEILSTVTKS